MSYNCGVMSNRFIEALQPGRAYKETADQEMAREIVEFLSSSWGYRFTRNRLRASGVDLSMLEQLIGKTGQAAFPFDIVHLIYDPSPNQMKGLLVNRMVHQHAQAGAFLGQTLEPTAEYHLIPGDELSAIVSQGGLRLAAQLAQDRICEHLKPVLSLPRAHQFKFYTTGLPTKEHDYFRVVAFSPFSAQNLADELGASLPGFHRALLKAVHATARS